MLGASWPAPCSKTSVASPFQVLFASLIFGAIAIAVVAAIARVLKANKTAAPVVTPRPPGGLVSADAITEAPFAKRQYFFSAAERSFYEIVRRLAPEHTVFAKVRLADLVRVQAKGREFWQRFNSISSKHVDFVLCDPQLAPVVAVELDDSSHEAEQRLKRDAFVDDVLAIASIPIVHIRAKRGYVLDEVREQLAPYLSAKSPAEAAHADAPYMPPAGWRPAL